MGARARFGRPSVPSTAFDIGLAIGLLAMNLSLAAPFLEPFAAWQRAGLVALEATLVLPLALRRRRPWLAFGANLASGILLVGSGRGRPPRPRPTGSTRITPGPA